MSVTSLGGGGQVILLGGEAGVGKSRLVAETKAYAAAQEFLLLQGNCFAADLSYPYAPWLDLLRSSYTNRLVAAIASDLTPFTRELHHLVPDIVPLPPDQDSRSSFDPEQEKRHLFTALAQFFTGQATKQPILLIIEDIHWSDDTSLEFLHYLARHCTGSGSSQAVPLQLLLTYRSEEVRPSLRHFLAQLDRERLTQEILLAPFTRSEVEGRLYQTQRRREEAEQAFSNARTLIEELAPNVPDEDAREHFLIQATAMLPQKRALTPGRAAKEAFGGLTAREREVATMIAEGKSNREIAEALVVSERTVESHVSNIMFKLGVQSRRQIRAWAIEKGL